MWWTSCATLGAKRAEKELTLSFYRKKKNVLAGAGASTAAAPSPVAPPAVPVGSGIWLLI